MIYPGLLVIVLVFWVAVEVWPASRRRPSTDQLSRAVTKEV